MLFLNHTRKRCSIKMKLSMILALTTVTSGVCANVNVTREHCDDEWTYHDGKCYLPRQEYENFGTADSTCSLFGGKLAHGYDQQSVDFLKQLVNVRSNYAWWYGIHVFYDIYIKVKDSSGYYEENHSAKLNNSFPLPTPKSFDEPSEANCIGYKYHSRSWSTRSFMSSVPCSTHLPYICRGELTVNTVSIHFVNTSKDMYYFSAPNDKRSYRNATRACEDKNMTLVSIRDSDENELIDEHLSSSRLGNIDPRWIGLKVNNGNYTWTDGIKMDRSVINWRRTLEGGHVYHPLCRVLLSDGTLDEADCNMVSAPFICVKDPQLSVGVFGCPPGWFRAAQSCYYHNSRDGQFKGTVAHAFCSKINAHLVSVDSLVEKFWLRDSILRHGAPEIWISMNDLVDSGNFVLADGSKPRPNVVTWEGALQGKGKCVRFYPTNEIETTTCNDELYPGCQYVSANGKCVSQDWVYFNGNCYYILDNQAYRYDYMVQYDRMLHFCYEDLAKYDSSISLTPLKLDSEELLQKFQGRNGWFWTGMKVKVGDVYKWADGSPVNMTLFSLPKQPYKGTPEKPRHCVVMTRQGTLRTMTCDTNEAEVVCEKEVPFTVESSPGNNGNIIYNTLPYYRKIYYAVMYCVILVTLYCL